MVSIALRIFVIVVSTAFMVYAIRLIVAGRLQVKYSLLWFAFALFALMSALFPDPVFRFARLLGFEQPSNFVFFVGILFILGILLSLSVIVSKQARMIISLVQENALTRYELERRENRDERE